MLSEVPQALLHDLSVTAVALVESAILPSSRHENELRINESKTKMLLTKAIKM